MPFLLCSSFFFSGYFYLLFDKFVGFVLFYFCFKAREVMSSTGQNVTDDHANFSKKSENIQFLKFHLYIFTLSHICNITWTWRYVGIDTDDATIWFFGHFKKRLKLVSGAGRHCITITTFQYRRLLLLISLMF